MYTLLLSYWMLYGFNRMISNDYQYNLIPLATIIEMFKSFNDHFSYVMINILGNIAVFIPFGVLLPIVVRWKYKRAFGVFSLGVILLELLQLVMRRGSLDIDDYILNSIGYVIGCMLIVYMKHKLEN